MKNIISIIGILFLAINLSFSQTETQPEYPRQLPTFNLFNEGHFRISAKVVAYDQYEITLENTQNKELKKAWSLRPFTINAFQNTLRGNLKSAEFSSISAKSATEIEEEAERIFYMFKSSDITIADLAYKPEAGKLCFQKEAKVERVSFENSDNLKKLAKDKLSIECTKTEGNKYICLDYGDTPMSKKTAIRKLIATEKNRRHQNRIDKYNLELDTLLGLKNDYHLHLDRIDSLKRVKANLADSKEKYQANYDKKAQEIQAEEVKLEQAGQELMVKAKDNIPDDMNLEAFLSQKDAKQYKKQSPKFTELVLDSINVIKIDLSNRKDDKTKLIQEISQIEMVIDTLNERIDSTKNEDMRNQIQLSREAKTTKKTQFEKELDSLEITIETQKGRIADFKNLQKLFKKHYQIRVTDLYSMTRSLSGMKGSITKADNKIVRIERKISSISSLDLKQVGDDLIRQNRKLTVAKNNLPETQFEIDYIEIEFNQGFIENILVLGDVYNFGFISDVDKIINREEIESKERVKFENLSPIGFSRKIDFETAQDWVLYTRGGKTNQYQINLEDILTIYIQKHEVDRRDFSPENGVIRFKRIDNTDCMTLYKEETYRIVQANVYSDFVGLDETEPNGLIQTEIKKNIPIVTTRRAHTKIPTFLHKLVFGKRVVTSWNFGFFAYFEPFVVLSKIERNNRNLMLRTRDKFINQTYSPVKFASTLDLKRFQNFETGADVNLFLWDFPSAKSTLFLDYGFSYGRTAVADSTRVNVAGITANNGNVDEYGVDIFEMTPEITWRIQADERYDFDFSWSQSWLFLRDTRFQQVANLDVFEQNETNPKDHTRFHTVKFLATLKNEKGNLFFRYKFNWQHGFWTTGFHQAQVGYSFFLLGKS